MTDIIQVHMYAVSRCSSCGRVHGLEVPVSKTTCRWCGKRYDPSKGSIVRTFQDALQMRAFIQGIQSVEGGSDSPIAEDPVEQKVPTPPSASRPGRSRVIRLIRKELSIGPRKFSEILSAMDEGTSPDLVEECLVAMQESGEAFRNKEGAYSLV
jgi:hypothetical protein